MIRTLHILKDSAAPEAIALIRQEARDPDRALEILLIQEAVTQPVALNDGLKIYILKDDLEQRGLGAPPEARYIPIDYPRMFGLIYEADRVVAW